MIGDFIGFKLVHSGTNNFFLSIIFFKPYYDSRFLPSTEILLLFIFLKVYLDKFLPLMESFCEGVLIFSNLLTKNTQ